MLRDKLDVFVPRITVSLVTQLYKNHARGNLLSHFSLICSLIVLKGLGNCPQMPMLNFKGFLDVILRILENQTLFFAFHHDLFLVKQNDVNKKGTIFGQMRGVQGKNRQSQAIYFCYVYFFFFNSKRKTATHS